MFQPNCPERAWWVWPARLRRCIHMARADSATMWDLELVLFTFVGRGARLCPLMRRLDENKQAYLPSVWRFLPSFLPSSRLLLPGRIRQDQSVINGLLWFCSLETSFPCHQSAGTEFSSYKLTSRRCRMTPPPNTVWRPLVEKWLLPLTPAALVVAARLFSLCWSVLPAAWWRSPHRSMAMGSRGADALHGSRWLVYFLSSEGKRCSQGPSLRHDSPPWLHPSKEWNEILFARVEREERSCAAYQYSHLSFFFFVRKRRSTCWIFTHQSEHDSACRAVQRYRRVFDVQQ